MTFIAVAAAWLKPAYAAMSRLTRSPIQILCGDGDHIARLSLSSSIRPTTEKSEWLARTITTLRTKRDDSTTL
jgi:hypothetical protein